MIAMLLSTLTYYALPIGLVIITMAIPIQETFFWYGRCSFALLWMLLFWRPVANAFNISFLKKTLIYRIQIAISAMWFSLFHVIMYAFIFDIVDEFDLGNIFFYLVIVFIGGIISFIFSADYYIKRFVQYKIEQSEYKKFFIILKRCGYLILLCLIGFVIIKVGTMQQFVIIMVLFGIVKIIEVYRRNAIT